MTILYKSTWKEHLFMSHRYMYDLSFGSLSIVISSLGSPRCRKSVPFLSLLSDVNLRTVPSMPLIGASPLALRDSVWITISFAMYASRRIDFLTFAGTSGIIQAMRLVSTTMKFWRKTMHCHYRKEKSNGTKPKNHKKKKCLKMCAKYWRFRLSWLSAQPDQSMPFACKLA